MSPECGLPNVDIFDPVQCTKRWNQCATQQQINVYLNSEIVRTQECLQLFKTAQAGVNEILDGKIKNHETRIATLEKAQADLTTAQNNLNAQFAVVQAQNTAYQTSVDNTLKLYQESINAITTTTNTLTTEQQKLWNEINALKGSIDVSKINEALAGYDAIMTQTKELIAANNAELNIQFKSLETKFNTLESNVNNALSDSEAALSKRFNTLSKTVTADIEAQNTRINNLVNTTSASIADLQAQISNGNSDVAKSIAAMQQDIKDLHTELKEGDAALGERIAAEEQARKDGDECLKGQIKASDAINSAAVAALDAKVTSDIDALDKKVTEEISTFETNTDLKILQIQNDLRNSQDAAIAGLDSKLTAEIKSVESDLSKQITELTYANAAEHKAINERIDGLETELADGVDERIAEAVAVVNTRVTNVETNAQNANDALELRVTKIITDGLAESNSDLSELTKRVDTQGELIQASRDEATLAWQTEIKDRIAGDEALKAEIAALDIEGVKAQIKDEVEAATAPIQEQISSTNEEIEKLKVSDGKQWTTINNTVESSNQLGERVTRLENMGGSGYDDTELRALIEVNKLGVAKNVSAIEDINNNERIILAEIDAVNAANQANAKAIKTVDEKRVSEHSALDARVTKLEEAEPSDNGYDDTALKARVVEVESTQLLHTTELEDHETRIKALEDAPSGGGEAYDDTAIKAEIAAVKKEVEAISATEGGEGSGPEHKHKTYGYADLIQMSASPTYTLYSSPNIGTLTLKASNISGGGYNLSIGFSQKGAGGGFRCNFRGNDVTAKIDIPSGNIAVDADEIGVITFFGSGNAIGTHISVDYMISNSIMYIGVRYSGQPDVRD